MNSVFKQLVDGVKEGKHFKIDLVKKSVKLNGKELICGEVVLIAEEDIKSLFPLLRYNNLFLESYTKWEIAEILYIEYKFSSPKRSVSGNKPYFKAIPEKELLERYLAYGQDRNVAQAILEGFVLCAGLEGWLTLNESKWFYQGSDRDFVVLKEWI